MQEDVTLDTLKAVREGDQGELVNILEGYRNRLRRMVSLRLDPRLRRRIDASDVIQESFLEATNRLGQYLDKPDMPFYLWVRFLTGQKLLQLHRFHLGAALRDARREVRMPETGMPAASSIMLASALVDRVSPSQVTARSEESARLEQALESLPEIDREVLALRHFEHFSNGEVAQLLGLKESAASRRYLRALTRLKEMIERQTRAPEEGRDPDS